eukprot:7824877-Pyramimonas_sp.AAC.1
MQLQSMGLGSRPRRGRRSMETAGAKGPLSSTSKKVSHKGEALLQARREIQQELLANPSKHGTSAEQATAVVPRRS